MNINDADVIERVHGIWRGRYGVAVNIHTRPPRKAGYQPQFHVAAHGDAARLVIADVAPLLGVRRRARVAELVGAGRWGLREAGACYHVGRAA